MTECEVQIRSLVLQDPLPEDDDGKAWAFLSNSVLREKGSRAQGSSQGRDWSDQCDDCPFIYLFNNSHLPSRQPFLAPFLFNLKELQNNKQRANICTNNQKVICGLKILVKSAWMASMPFIMFPFYITFHQRHNTVSWKWFTIPFCLLWFLYKPGTTLPAP